MPTIRIDEQVYSWLQKNARPFEDTPNSALRRLAGLDRVTDMSRSETQREVEKHVRVGVTNRSLNGRMLKEQWKIPAAELRYHRDGHFFENVRNFPAALCDPHGYVLFSSQVELRNTPKVRIGKKTNVRGGIASLPGYKRMI